MDLELLNYWIKKMNFNIHEDTLYMSLESCDIDFCNTCKFVLSSNKNKILEFFGYDTTIDYDHLKSYNIYEFLCTSTKLLPNNIQYDGFKGPSAKNSEHVKYNKYLLQKYSDNKKYRIDDIENNKFIKKFNEDAIKFFKKENNFELYKFNFNILNKLFKKKENIEKINHSEFCKFVSLHGILTIIKWSDDKFYDEWDLYKKSLWNEQLSIIIRPYI